MVLVLIFFVFLQTGYLDETVCSKEYEHLMGDKCIFTISQEETFDEAEAHCGRVYESTYGYSHDVHLCSFHNELELEYIASLTNHFDGMWIGLQKKPGWRFENVESHDWYTWSDGSEVSLLPELSNDDENGSPCHRLVNSDVALDYGCTGTFSSCCSYNMPECSTKDKNQHCWCVANQTCVCPKGHSYDEIEEKNCANFTCWGFYKRDPNVCSGDGRCVSSDNCICDTSPCKKRWFPTPCVYGDRCQEKIGHWAYSRSDSSELMMNWILDVAEVTARLRYSLSEDEENVHVKCTDIVVNSDVLGYNLNDGMDCFFKLSKPLSFLDGPPLDEEEEEPPKQRKIFTEGFYVTLSAEDHSVTRDTVFEVVSFFHSETVLVRHGHVYNKPDNLVSLYAVTLVFAFLYACVAFLVIVAFVLVISFVCAKAHSKEKEG